MREPADHAARDAALLAKAVAHAGLNAVVVDLGSGTGSTARAFINPVCNTWTWRFIDSEQALLNVAQEHHPRSEQCIMNLDDIDQLPLDHADLVTASALLDLMPGDWVSRLAARLKKAHVPFYAALNYNGTMLWEPADKRDDAITAAFNQHQRTDKGIGPALGPLSGTTAARIFSEHGFVVSLAESPWKLGTEHHDLHLALIEGIGHAANETDNLQATDWVKAHEANIANTMGYIGHTDLLAVPTND